MRNKKLFGCFLVLAAVIFGAGVRAESSPDETNRVEGLWVCSAGQKVYVVEQRGSGEKAGVAVGFREGEKPWIWDSLMGQVKSAAAMGEDLYLLFEDGTILRQGDAYNLPSLPAGVKAERLVSGAKGEFYVLAVREGGDATSQASQPAVLTSGLRWTVYELNGGEWRAAAELPAEIGGGEPTVLAGEKGLDVIWRSGPLAKAVGSWWFSEGQWQRGEDFGLPENEVGVKAVGLGDEAGLLISEPAEGGVTLKLYRLENGKLIKEAGVLKAEGTPWVVEGTFAVSSGPEGGIVAGWLAEGGKSVRLARWSADGEAAGKVETVSGGGIGDGSKEPSWWVTVLPGLLLLLIVLFRGFTLPNGETMPAEMALGQFWRRGLAFLIDFIPMSFLFSLIWSDYFAQLGQMWYAGMSMEELVRSNPKLYMISFWMYGVYTVYCILMEGRLGWTLGKRAMGLEVRSLRDMSVRATWKQVIFRNLTKVFELDSGLLLLIVVFSRYRQRIGDMLAGTVVLQKKIDRGSEDIHG